MGCGISQLRAAELRPDSPYLPTPSADAVADAKRLSWGTPKVSAGTANTIPRISVNGGLEGQAQLQRVFRRVGAATLPLYAPALKPLCSNNAPPRRRRMSMPSRGAWHDPGAWHEEIDTCTITPAHLCQQPLGVGTSCGTRSGSGSCSSSGTSTSSCSCPSSGSGTGTCPGVTDSGTGSGTGAGAESWTKLANHR